MKLISGAQTGVDRAALDVAIDLGMDWGGWAPYGWRAEDGQIPEKYRERMRTCESDGYPVRTRRNVEEAGATLILGCGADLVRGGTFLTSQIASRLGRPVLLVDLRPEWAKDPEHVYEWVTRFAVLNVAGPRESKSPGVHELARAYLNLVFSNRSGVSRA